MILDKKLIRTCDHLKAVELDSFESGKSEFVRLLPDKGAYKTTIMKMLTGYLEPTSDCIETDGLDINSQRSTNQQSNGYLSNSDPLCTERTVIDCLVYTASLHRVPENKCLDPIRESGRNAVHSCYVRTNKGLSTGRSAWSRISLEQSGKDRLVKPG